MQKIKISAVSYLNSRPFIYGLDQSPLIEEIDLSLDIPSVCAKKLLTNEVDIGLVPIAILPEMKEYHIITDYCIGANGAVKSVVLFSNVPLTAIDSITLDYQSRTSVQLVKVLAEQFWKITPTWKESSEGFEKNAEGNEGVVVIGDRALELTGYYKYTYDLSEEWKKYTGLPFVFACWISNKKLAVDFIERFNTALKFGLENKSKAVEDLKLEIGDSLSAEDYLNNYISFDLNEEKKRGMELFLKLVAEKIEKQNPD